MIDYWQLLLLGSIAGFTIFLGLPVAALQRLTPKQKGFFNALAIGILAFLIIDVFSHAWEKAADAANDAFAGKSPVGSAVLDLLAMFGGLAVGLLGLVFYESKYMMKVNTKEKQPPSSSTLAAKGGGEGGEKQELITGSSSRIVQGLDQQQQRQLELNAYRLAMMIAIGIGAHNFSEGLAIGQSYISGSIGMAVLLIIGFGSHNATEGFGIAGPLTGFVKKPKVQFLILAGLVGGGPTFIGTVVGSLWISDVAYVLFLSIAGGALVYVSMLMYSSGRRQTTNSIIMTGIFVGLCLGFITDLIVTLGGA